MNVLASFNIRNNDEMRNAIINLEKYLVVNEEKLWFPSNEILKYATFSLRETSLFNKFYVLFVFFFIFLYLE